MTHIQFSASAPSRTYKVLVGDALFESPDLFLEDHLGRTFIITDSNVAGLYLERVHQALRERGVEVESYVIAPGEKSKSFQTVDRLYTFLAEHFAARADTLMALGGGVVGDVTGFVASTFKRGMQLVQIPTTLVSQVDSSLGGKTGINLPGGKNLVGTFYQPVAILVEISTLRTLPEREYIAGLAEVIKYGITLDLHLFRFLEQNHNRVLQRDPRTLGYIVERCLRHKARIVENDEREESGLRGTLSFGHTIGHVLEICSDFRYSHGEAVAVGMVQEALVSVRMGVLDSSAVERIKTLLDIFGLPTHVKLENESKRLSGVLRQDKKARQGGLLTPLLIDIGTVNMRAVEPSYFLEQLARCREPC